MKNRTEPSAPVRVDYPNGRLEYDVDVRLLAQRCHPSGWWIAYLEAARRESMPERCKGRLAAEIRTFLRTLRDGGYRVDGKIYPSGGMTMQGVLAIAREEKMHCLSGQFRFTEWVGPESADGKVSAALALAKQDGFEVVDVRSRNGVVRAKPRHSAVPGEMLSWFEYFEGKGIPAAIVKNRVTGEYAVFRNGFDSNADEDGDGPELLRRTEIMVLRKCNGFSLRLMEY